MTVTAGMMPAAPERGKAGETPVSFPSETH